MPDTVYQMQALLAKRLPALRPAQIAGLTLWVYGILLAGRATQSAVACALSAWLRYDTARQRLREWLYDGADKARPTAQQIEVSACFADLLAWTLACLPGASVVLAVDVTFLADRHAILCVSVVSGQTALPVAWRVGVANQPDAWMTPLLALLQALRPALPRTRRVLVLTDRGLWSPRLFTRLKRLGLHPLMRVHNQVTFTPSGGRSVRAASLVQPDTVWIGRGHAFAGARRRKATLVAVWLSPHTTPCLCLTDLRPRQMTGYVYGLRFWIEAGFRALKRGGWDWEATRRTDAVRVSRHCLALAVATLWSVSASEPSPPQPTETGVPVCKHPVSRVRQGRLALLAIWLRGEWFAPTRLPALPPLAWPRNVAVTYYKPT